MAQWSVITASALASLLIMANGNIAETTVPATFIFGDSTIDVGTNNYLPIRKARADFEVNGIDYAGTTRPTGRFSNDFNIADSIARLYGFKRSPPPFLYLTLYRKSSFLRDILRGANFASGGAGLLETTGLQFVEQFATVCNNISQIMGEAADSVISKWLILISIGSNDIFEYMMFNQTHNQQEFMTILMNSYRAHSLVQPIESWSQKVWDIEFFTNRCIPRFRAQNPTGRCIEPMNSYYAQMFFTEIQGLMRNLSLEFRGMPYSIANSYDMTMDILDSPLAFGFKDVITACRGVSKLGAEQACLPNSTICENRDDFFFWDRHHPSQKGSEVAAATHYGAAQRFVTPISLSRLAGDGE